MIYQEKKLTPQQYLDELEVLRTIRARRKPGPVVPLFSHTPEVLYNELLRLRELKGKMETRPDFERPKQWRNWDAFERRVQKIQNQVLIQDHYMLVHLWLEPRNKTRPGALSKELITRKDLENGVLILIKAVMGGNNKPRFNEKSVVYDVWETCAQRKIDLIGWGDDDDFPVRARNNGETLAHASVWLTGVPLVEAKQHIAQHGAKCIYYGAASEDAPDGAVLHRGLLVGEA